MGWNRLLQQQRHGMTLTLASRSRLQSTVVASSPSQLQPQEDPNPNNNQYTSCLEDVDLWQSDKTLQRAIRFYRKSSFKKHRNVETRRLSQQGRSCGSSQIMTIAQQAVVANHNNHKNDDEDEDDSHVQTLLEHGIQAGVVNHGYSHHSLQHHSNQHDDVNENEEEERLTARAQEMDQHVTRAALFHMQIQLLEPTHCIPLSITRATIPILLQQQQQQQQQQQYHPHHSPNNDNDPYLSEWLSKTLLPNYRRQPPPNNNNTHHDNNDTALLLGLATTMEQQGEPSNSNSMIIATQQQADHPSSDDTNTNTNKWYMLNDGGKSCCFTLAPVADGFITVAKEKVDDRPDKDDGNNNDDNNNNNNLACFLVPRRLPSGEINGGLVIQTTSDTTHANHKKAQVEYTNAHAYRIGDVSQFWELVQRMHLDGILASAGMSRQALSISLDQFYTSQSQQQQQQEEDERDVAIMENSLANLCLMVDACTLSAIRMAVAAAASTNASTQDEKEEANVCRVGVAIFKYYCTQIQPQLIKESLQVLSLGGNHANDVWLKEYAYYEDPAVLSSAGMAVALEDVWRAKDAIPSFLRDLEQGIAGSNVHMDAYCRDLWYLWTTFMEQQQQQQHQAHNLVHRLAIGYQASLLLKCGSPVAASAFLETRIRPLVLHKDSMTKKNIDDDDGSLFGSHENWLLQELDRKDHPNYGGWTALEPDTARSIVDDHMPVFTLDPTY